MSITELELQARKALLEYYASLMQSYKVFILTFAVSILTVFELWFRLHKPELTTWDSLLSLILGGTFAGILICIERWLWCGHIVTSAINASAPAIPTMANFDREIKNYARNQTNWIAPAKPRLSRRIKRFVQKLWIRLILVGDSKIQLAIGWLIMVLIFGLVVFQYVAPLFQT
jgi:cell division protein FtsL